MKKLDKVTKNPDNQKKQNHKKKKKKKKKKPKSTKDELLVPVYLRSKIYIECTMQDASLRKDPLYILQFGMLFKRLKVIISIVLLPPLSYWWKKSHGHLVLLIRPSPFILV